MPQPKKIRKFFSFAFLAMAIFFGYVMFIQIALKNEWKKEKELAKKDSPPTLSAPFFPIYIPSNDK